MVYYEVFQELVSVRQELSSKDTRITELSMEVTTKNGLINRLEHDLSTLKVCVCVCVCVCACVRVCVCSVLLCHSFVIILLLL